MPLDRKKVRLHVDKHWFTVCDDGYFCSYTQGPQVHVEAMRTKLAGQGKLPDSKSWRMVFLPEVDASDNLVNGEERACFVRENPAGQTIPAGTLPAALTGKFDIVPFHHDKGLVDCAHYVSNCLSAGGLKVNDPSVPSLVTQFQSGAFAKETKTLGEKVSKEVGDRILATGVMEFGDIVAFAHGAKDGYAHSALYAGKDADRPIHRITCHTLSRMGSFYNGDTWNITSDSAWRFTLIHFDTGSDAIPEAIARLFQPVFAIDQAGKTEFYKFAANGKVERRSKAPVSAANFGPPEARGYWFVRGPEVFVFWPKDGRVVRFDLPKIIASAIGGLGNALPVLVNGAAGVARRLGL